MALNNCTFIGRISKELEIKTTQGGVSVISYDLAVDRDFKDKQGNKETDWIPCVTWRHDAEYLAKYAHKGDILCVRGRLTPRKWQDKDGNKRTAFEVQTDNVYIVSSSKPRDSRGKDDGYDSGESFQPAEDDGDLPF